MPTRQRTHHGRRRFAASKKLEPTKSATRPYGFTHPLIDYGNRRALLKFFPPVVAGNLGVIPDVPLNFVQTAEVLLGEKRQLSRYPALLNQLEYYQRCNNGVMVQHPHWNATELPHQLLREALSQCPEAALKSYDVVRRALARLYSVVWYGHGPESGEAKRLLEQLIPKGRRHPITNYLPEIAVKFRELRRWILESNNLMLPQFPDKTDRLEKLSELYAEPTRVVSAALELAEKAFLAERLSEVLQVPVPTVKKHLQKLPAS